MISQKNKRNLAAFQQDYDLWRLLRDEQAATGPDPLAIIVEPIRAAAQDKPIITVSNVSDVWPDRRPESPSMAEFIEDWGQAGHSQHIGNILASLKTRTSGSLAALICRPIPNHWSLVEVLSVMGECKRILMPGGVLILETQNPEFIENPISAPEPASILSTELLKFALEREHFDNVTLLDCLTLNTPANSDAAATTALLRPFRSMSATYFAVAQAPGDAALTKTLKAILGSINEPPTALLKPSGSSAEAIVETQHQLINTLHNLQSSRDVASRLRASLALTRAEQQSLNERLHQVTHAKQNLRVKMSGLQNQLHQSNVHLDAYSTALHARDVQIDALYRSFSWRITRPMRILSRLLRSPKTLGRDLLVRVDRASVKTPRIRKALARTGQIAGIDRDRLGYESPAKAALTPSAPSIWSIEPPRDRTKSWERTLKRNG